jgi:hypothetical protein
VAGSGAAAYAAVSKTPEPLLDTRPVAAKIRSAVATQTPVRAVTCPQQVPDRANVRFACTVSLAGTNQRWLAIVTHGADGRDTFQIRLAG